MFFSLEVEDAIVYFYGIRRDPNNTVHVLSKDVSYSDTKAAVVRYLT